MTRQRGITLIEIIAVMGASTLILALVAGTIQSLARGERAVERQLRESEVLAELSSSFRRHVHAANHVVTAEGGSKIEMVLSDDHTIGLTADENRVQEMESKSGQVVRRQTYNLGVGSVAHFEVESGSGQTIASLSLRRRLALLPDGDERDLRFEALVGRDLRHRARRE